MHVPDHLVDVFKAEFEVTHSLDAAVAAVATAVLARVAAPPPAPAPPPRPPVQLRGLPSAAVKRPPGRVRVSGERVVAVRASVAALYQETPQLLFDRRWATRASSAARWVAAAVFRRMGMSMREIAEHVGLADHSTVVYGLRQVEARADLAERADVVWREIHGVATAQPQGQGTEAAA